MREIKFRVWHPVSKYWSHWGFTEPTKGIFAGIPSSNEAGFDMEYVRNNSNQFTGLRDKNGKDIYEGDIMAFSCDFDTSSSPVMRTVTFVRGCFCMDLPIGSDHYCGLEVIGNIYENPELLK